MELQKDFEIILRRPIRVLTKSTSIGIFFMFAILFVFWVFMIPATGSKSSDEMKASYFLLAVPDWLKYLSSIAILGLVILIPLNLIRKKVPAHLSFYESEIRIRDKQHEFVLPIARIKKLLVNDLKDPTGFPKGILQVVLEFSNGRLESDGKKVFVIQHYEEVGQLLDQISLAGIQLSYFDSPSTIEFDEQ